jgi:CRP-like cAMP-binding protein
MALPAPDHLEQIARFRKTHHPGVGLLSIVDGDGKPVRPIGQPFYVDVYGRLFGELLLRAGRRIAEGSRFRLFMHRFPRRGWTGFQGRVTWTEADPTAGDFHLLGCSVQPAGGVPPSNAASGSRRSPSAAEYQFFLTVDFLRGIHPDSVCPLLNCVRFRRVAAGERFIRQGDEGRDCWLIQSGSCRVVLETQGQLRPLAVIRERELVGEMALLTGEPRSAQVDAMTDMELWSISRKDFDALIAANPEMGAFLTEIVAEKFAARKFTADRRIGDYVITDILGRGAFAVVYDGYDARTNRPVAVKMLRHDLAMNPDFLGKFRREARIIAEFDHDNIVRVFDFEERFRTLFIVMERLDGCSLRERLSRSGPFAPAEAVHVLVQTCRALAYAHERSIVHQDVHPGNLFLVSGGRVKLVDFGLAVPCGSSGSLSGTPFYMSPEQIECRSVDGRTDIYSLGLTAYEMVCGRRPYPDADAFKVMILHLENDIPDPGAAMPDLPTPLRDFILNACRRDPSARYASVREALKDLEAIP